MKKLNDLTRTFHDATIIKIDKIEESICIYMTVYEIGDCYGSLGENENRELLSEQEIESIGEYKRQLKIIFYNTMNIESEFDITKMNDFILDIVDFKINNNVVYFGCNQEYVNGLDGWQNFSFESKGFDLIYLKDKERKI